MWHLLWAEQSDNAYKSGLIPPSLFLGGNPLEEVLPVCMGVLPLCLCEWQTGSRLEKGGTKGTLSLAFTVLLQMSLPSSCPAGSLVLALGQQQQAALCSLPAVGSTRLKWPSWRFDQNVLKAFPQILSFNFPKSYLVALRTLAVWEDRVMSWKQSRMNGCCVKGCWEFGVGWEASHLPLRGRSPCHVVEKRVGV